MSFVADRQAPSRSAAATLPRWFSRRLLLTLGSTCMALGLLATWEPARAWAWGGLGHRMAGQIAWDRLNPHAKTAVQDLLDPGQTLSGVSTWADEVRKDRSESASWHYVNVPITEAKYHARYEDPKGGVVSRVTHFQQVLADTAAPRVQRQEALKFLVHFLQDMHQPVHVGHRDDRGGNLLQVRFFDEGSNLHRVWDSNLLEHAHRSQADYVRDLEARITPEAAAEWSQGTPEDWANESLALAKGAYTQPGTPGELKPGAKLGQGYYDANLPLAEQRIEQAGVRLAAVLNRIFP